MQISGGNPTYNKISESHLIFSMLMLLLVIPLLSLSQIRSVKKSLTHDYFQVGFDAGITYFFGDVDDKPAQGGLFQNNMAYKLHVGRNFGSLLLINAQISFGNVSGEKKKDEFYSYFKSSFIET